MFSEVWGLLSGVDDPEMPAKTTHFRWVCYLLLDPGSHPLLRQAKPRTTISLVDLQGTRRRSGCSQGGTYCTESFSQSTMINYSPQVAIGPDRDPVIRYRPTPWHVSPGPLGMDRT